MSRAGSPRATQAFAQLLRAGSCTVIPGAHDALTARMVEADGYRAVYVGSFGTSAAAHGMPDTGLLTLDDMADQARRVVRAVGIPVLADAEAGFYPAANLWRAIEAYEASGVAGVHLEDNLGGKHSDAPAGLMDPRDMALKMRAASDARRDPDFTLIARSDALWVGGNLDGCVERLQRCIDAGADAVFPTGITASQLDQVRSRLKAPVMVLGDLPEAPGQDYPASSLRDFESAGADIVVLFYTLLGAAVHGVKQALERIRTAHDVRRMEGLVEGQRAFEASMGYDAYAARVKKYRRSEE